MSHLLAGIIGAAVGDALGVPYEHMKRDTFLCEEMVSDGQLYPVGTWSDDTSLLLASVDSLAQCGRFVPEHTMACYADWLYNGKYCSVDHPIGVGRTTSVAIGRFRQGINAEMCGGMEILDNGNGALMRMLPYALLKENQLSVAERSARMTHAHAINLWCCRLYTHVVEGILDGLDPAGAVKSALSLSRNCISPLYLQKLDALEILDRAMVESSAFAPNTLTAALWCLVRTGSYEDAVLTAVNLGEDTDTVACVTGGLAGIYYGFDPERGIPEAWARALVRCDYIESLCAAADPLMR